MIDGPSVKQMQSLLKEFAKKEKERELKEIHDSINSDFISKKYYELMNLVAVNKQIIKKINALESIMSSFPSSYTLAEVKEYLVDSNFKYENLIRDFISNCLNYKEEII